MLTKFEMVQSVSSWQSTTGSEPCRLRIGHVNVYHLYSKVQNVGMLPTKSPYVHLLGLSETRLDSSLGDESLSIPIIPLFEVTLHMVDKLAWCYNIQKRRTHH